MLTFVCHWGIPLFWQIIIDIRNIIIGISASNKFKFMISLFDTINNEDISDLNNFVFYDIGSISF